jgi:hypothetical protein
LCGPSLPQSGYREAMHSDIGAPPSETSKLKAEPRPINRVLLWVLAVLASLAVFGAYLEPALMVTLGNAIWSCF